MPVTEARERFGEVVETAAHRPVFLTERGRREVVGLSRVEPGGSVSPGRHCAGRARRRTGGRWWTTAVVLVSAAAPPPCTA